MVGDLNAATDGIRDYIRALAQPPATPEGIAAGLGELTRRFSEETGRDVRFARRGARRRAGRCPTRPASTSSRSCARRSRTPPATPARAA